MNHIILADGTTFTTSQETENTFLIPLEKREDFKELLSKITDENIGTIQIATEENVIVEQRSNLTLSCLALQTEQADDALNYTAALTCRPADKTAQQLAEQQTSIEDLSTAVAGLLYGEEEEDNDGSK